MSRLPTTTAQLRVLRQSFSQRVLEGEVRLTDSETGDTCICGPGTRARAPAGWLHREEHAGYKALIGLSVERKDFAQSEATTGTQAFITIYAGLE